MLSKFSRAKETNVNKKEIAATWERKLEELMDDVLPYFGPKLEE